MLIPQVLLSEMKGVSIVVVSAILISPSVYATPPIDLVENIFPEIDYFSNDSDRLVMADLLQQKCSPAGTQYDEMLEQHPADAARLLWKIAQSYNVLSNEKSQITNIEQCLLVEFISDIPITDTFDSIRDTVIFKNLEDKYSPKFGHVIPIVG